VSATSTTKYWTVGEYAKSRGIGEEKVLDWIASGQLAAINLAARAGGRPRWRIPQDAIDCFEAGRTSAPAVKPPAAKRRSRPADYVQYFEE
jgi:hypothetical protein